LGEFEMSKTSTGKADAITAGTATPLAAPIDEWERYFFDPVEGFENAPVPAATLQSDRGAQQ
jgi:hypothetical protein